MNNLKLLIKSWQMLDSQYTISMKLWFSNTVNRFKCVCYLLHNKLVNDIKPSLIIMYLTSNISWLK